MLTFKEYLHEQFQYHETLNPKLWRSNKKLHGEVQARLLVIANEFIEFIDDPDFQVQDIILTGSQANFNYTPKSDIDLHLISTISSAEGGECAFNLADFFKAKKTLWNEQHDITIYDIPVELYIQLADEPVVTLGVYSVLNDQWLQEPTRNVDVEQIDRYAVGIKATEIKAYIDRIIDDRIDNVKAISELKEKIRLMRKAGLEKGGEFSMENLTFKELRNAGYLDKLTDYQRRLQDTKLSLK